jgi:hemolysin-activating ACP:hemolysin acyltransferase
MGKEIDRVIKLYQKFPKYSQASSHDIFWHFYPSIRVHQYKIFEDWGFCNWALLSNYHAEKYKQTGDIDYNSWNSGNNIFIVEIVATKHGSFIAKNILSELFIKYGKKNVSWVRINDNKIIRKTTRVLRKTYG